MLPLSDHEKPKSKASGDKEEQRVYCREERKGGRRLVYFIFAFGLFILTAIFATLRGDRAYLDRTLYRTVPGFFAQSQLSTNDSSFNFVHVILYSTDV